MHKRGRAGGLVSWALIPWVMGVSRGLSEKHTTISAGWDVLFTQAPLHRRDETECPPNYSLCPASLDGGCCPSDHSCGVSSCYATTAAPPPVCSSTGYVACGVEQGGGCCPGGYSCASNGCILVSGSSTEACSAGSYMCPEALGYGCCRNGLACGNGYCYATTYPTVSITREILTTDSNFNVITVTTVVATAYVPSAVPTLQTTAVTSSAISKFTPTETAVAKVAATSAPSSGGLGTGALAGIISAAVVILIAILVASFLIIRRLNAVATQSKGSQMAKSGSNRTSKSSNNPGNDPPGGPPGTFESTPTSSQSPNMSANPLLLISSDSGSLGPPPRPSPMHSTSGSQEFVVSPPLPSAQYGWPLANPLQSHLYQPAPAAAAADAQYFDTRHHSRQNSEDFTQQYPGHPWDAQPSPPPAELRDQNLRFGHHRPSLQAAGHGRHWSSASSVPSTRPEPGESVAVVAGASDPAAGGAIPEFAPPAAAAAAAPPPSGTTAATRPVGLGLGLSAPPDRRSRRMSFDFMAAHWRRRSGGTGAPLLLEGQSVRESQLEEVVEGGGLQFPNQAERNSLAGATDVPARPVEIGEGK